MNISDSLQIIGFKGRGQMRIDIFLLCGMLGVVNKWKFEVETPWEPILLIAFFVVKNIDLSAQGTDLTHTK